jgi:hypothetical protein
MSADKVILRDRIPSWSLLDRTKPYTPSYQTNIRDTFRKVREALQQQEAREKPNAKVRVLRTR